MAATLVLLLSLLFFSFFCTNVASQQLDIIILAGQSNMAGRGGVSHGKWDGVIPQACSPNPSILRLNAGLQWEQAHEPLHADIDVSKTNGVGPGMSFANGVIATQTGATVGLIPCAIGGTKIDRWAKGTTSYDTMVRRANAGRGGGRGEIKAVLWYQGESDTVDRTDADSYKGKIEKLLRDLRSDLGLPDLLVIQVALASGEGEFVDVVREAQFEISSSVSNVVTVDAKGLEVEEDHLHLTTNSQVVLGGKLASSYLQHHSLRDNNTIVSSNKVRKWKEKPSWYRSVTVGNL